MRRRIPPGSSYQLISRQGRFQHFEGTQSPPRLRNAALSSVDVALGDFVFHGLLERRREKTIMRDPETPEASDNNIGPVRVYSPPSSPRNARVAMARLDPRADDLSLQCTTPHRRCWCGLKDMCCVRWGSFAKQGEEWVESRGVGTVSRQARLDRRSYRMERC